VKVVPVGAMGTSQVRGSGHTSDLSQAPRVSCAVDVPGLFTLLQALRDGFRVAASAF